MIDHDAVMKYIEAYDTVHATMKTIDRDLLAHLLRQGVEDIDWKHVGELMQVNAQLLQVVSLLQGKDD